MVAKTVFNRAPLPPNRFAPLPLTAIQPEGWLQQELQAHAEGLTGHLFEIWPDVGDDSGWLGGSGEAWERGPYYLDGLLPLAFLLNDERLKARALRMIEWTLASQREDGWFGPDQMDWWPRMVMLKVLMQYHGATADSRVPVFMLRYFKYQYDHLEDHPLEMWAAARAGDNMLAVLWLYNLTGKKFLLTLCKKLQAQTMDWTSWLHTMPVTQPTSKVYPWMELAEGMEQEDQDPKGFHTLHGQFTHVVNIAMGLKMPAMQYLFAGGLKNEMAFQIGFEKLMKHHGVAYGMFTGDEHLSGASPSQGTECCAVVELMFTLETLLWAQGNPMCGDILEKLAFNALPATLTADRRGHQYVQQANQILVSRDKRGWYNNGPEANLFGLEPNFGCCTANMHQGFPKYAASLWMASQDGGLAAMSYAPCTVRYRLAGQLVRLHVETQYPYGQEICVRLSIKHPAQFPLHFRIPAWATDAQFAVNAEEMIACAPGTFATLERVWQEGDVVHLRLPMQPRMTRWYHRSAAVEYGPLLFAFQPKEDWTRLGGNEFSPDWTVKTDSVWNYALLENSTLTVHVEDGEAERKHPMLSIEADAVQLSDWGIHRHSVAPIPIAPKADTGTKKTIRLVPYGDTGLRIAQFPVVETKK